MIDLHLGDCLEIMKQIPDGSVDAIICDLPYGTTQNKWDSVINLDALWIEYKRICNGAIVLTAQTPFDKVLGFSNLKMLKYEWIWVKENGTGFLNAKKAPLKNVGKRCSACVRSHFLKDDGKGAIERFECYLFVPR
jgi:site-specific DNA-methyltransferase (adenine-specific)